MRKNVLILFVMMMFFLTACGSNELNEFAEEFNSVSESEDLAKIDPERFGEVEEEDGEKWQELYESDAYTISADYNNSNDIISYRIMIESSEPFEDQEGRGYRASVSMADALGLSPSDFASNFNKALTEDQHSYSEGNYNVVFTNIGWDASFDTSLFIRFEKQ